MSRQESRQNHRRPRCGPSAPPPPSSPAASPTLRLALLLALSVFLLLTSSLASPEVLAAPRGPVLASITGIREPGLRRVDFALDQPTLVHVRSEGASDPKGEVFLSRGWILDLNSRRPAWVLDNRSGSWDRHAKDWSAEADLTLPPGIYAAYFAAYGGPFPVDKRVNILGFEIGRFQISTGPVIRWDKTGTPERWGIEVQAQDAGFRPPPVPRAPLAYPDAAIRLLGLRDSTWKHQGFELTRPVDFRIHFTGEYTRDAKDFVDAAWISERARWARVWMPDWENTEPAGGAEKNREFDGVVRLEPGSYLLTAATDQTHATGDWNVDPPWDPEAWGIALTPVNPGDRAFLRLTDSELPRADVAIARMESDHFVKKPFTLTRSAEVFLRGEGEKASVNWSDFGWIERARDLDVVWHMRRETSYPAGGARKNRLVEAVASLPAGDYALCYMTDDSHAFGDWNQEEPWDPDAWGLSLAVLDPRGESDLRAGPPRANPLIVSLAPAGNDEEKVKVFDVSEAVEVLLVALGEGTGGEMHDYGWLQEESTGRKLWTLTYGDSEPAGGARKNRMARSRLTLRPGAYSLHYVSDDSHSYGDWNAAPPDQPELWGITMIELK